METINGSLKSVTANTKFEAITLCIRGQNKNALIDQDGDVVGLIENDRPFYINGTKLEAIKAASRALKLGACYKGYEAIPFGSYSYTLVTNDLETTNSPGVEAELSELLARAVNLANESAKLNERVNGTTIHSTGFDEAIDEANYYEVPHP